MASKPQRRPTPSTSMVLTIPPSSRLIPLAHSQKIQAPTQPQGPSPSLMSMTMIHPPFLTSHLQTAITVTAPFPFHLAHGATHSPIHPSSATVIPQQILSLFRQQMAPHNWSPSPSMVLMTMESLLFKLDQQRTLEIFSPQKLAVHPHSPLLLIKSLPQMSQFQSQEMMPQKTH